MGLPVEKSMYDTVVTLAECGGEATAATAGFAVGRLAPFSLRRQLFDLSRVVMLRQAVRLVRELSVVASGGGRWVRTGNDFQDV
jgi:hypothetical protein